MQILFDSSLAIICNGRLFRMNLGSKIVSYFNNNQSFPMDNNCGRLFLDCQGQYDFAGQIFNTCSTLFVLGLAIRNRQRLKMQGINRLDAEQEESRQRKLRINLMCIVFLGVLFIQITYSWMAFVLTYNFANDKLEMSSLSASIGYKIVEIICINVLNYLIVSVGELYWSAVNVYQLGNSASRIQRHSCIKFFYHDWMKKVFFAIYVAAAVCVVLSAFLLIWAHGVDRNDDYTAENVLNFVVTMLSILIFLFARVECYYVIQRNQDISKGQLRKEFIYTALVVIMCVLRIISYWLAILNKDPSHTLRVPRDGDCYDEQFYHALYIIGLTLLVNLLPPFVFIDIFKATTKTAAAGPLSATLTEAEYSSQI